MESAPLRCILCHTPEREKVIEKDNWSVYRCPKCGLGFLDPRPSEKEIENLYRSEYFSEQYDRGLDPDSVEYKKRLRGEQHRLKFIKSIKSSGSLLDVGCGYGYFLDASSKRGYRVQGLDVSHWAAQYAVEKLKLSVTAGKMENVNFPEKTFDIITMWHSLEHIPDPRTAVQRAKRWLKPDGILVIDVPDYESTDARQTWEKWVGWQFPYHYWHFTFKSVKKLLEQNNFRIVKKKDYHSEVIKNRLNKIPILNIFARPIAKFYSGTSVAVIAKQIP